jgi:acetyl-CoA carboxylase biotin carboxylase subunit
VAVYSDADANSPHVRYADEAVRLGPPPSAESYLLSEVIIEEANRRGVDAIHPGYGFLSENAGFARQVREAGLIFVGPPPEAIELMGSKLASKQAVHEYGVPLVPGLSEAITDVPRAKQLAEDIGFPVLIKASAGGGGKGMRIVHSAEEFEPQMERAVSEAQNAFGDGAVFVEKFAENPRHIEIQVLADAHGNAVHLFERECSIQRRHQKVIEEAPSALLTPELRAQMGEAALNVVRAAGYVNAGTVEFIVDKDTNFYFLEMNTRLQVEHPVTEMITGLDLVEEQLRVARGEALRYRQDDLGIDGHALEVRVYAEDPTNEFLPDIGRLMAYRPPEGLGIRVDDGYREGMDVPIYYDPMLAKLIVHAGSREEAIAKMLEAIRRYVIVGCMTTLDFCRFVMQHEAFTSGDFTTNFVAEHFSPEKLDEPLTEEEERAAALAGLELYAEAVRKQPNALPTLATRQPKRNAWEIRRG